MTEEQKMGASDFHRITAAFCNNEAWSLLESPYLDAAQAARLVTLSATARHHWHEVGTASNISHADSLFWVSTGAGRGRGCGDGGGSCIVGTLQRGRFGLGARICRGRDGGSLSGQRRRRRFAHHYSRAEALGGVLDEDDAVYFQAAFMTLG